MWASHISLEGLVTPTYCLSVCQHFVKAAQQQWSIDFTILVRVAAFFCARAHCRVLLRARHVTKYSCPAAMEYWFHHVTKYSCPAAMKYWFHHVIKYSCTAAMEDWFHHVTKYSCTASSTSWSSSNIIVQLIIILPTTIHWKWLQTLKVIINIESDYKQ